jgi:hypothetical protein
VTTVCCCGGESTARPDVLPPPFSASPTRLTHLNHPTPNRFRTVQWMSFYGESALLEPPFELEAWFLHSSESISLRPLFRPAEDIQHPQLRQLANARRDHG